MARRFPGAVLPAALRGALLAVAATGCATGGTDDGSPVDGGDDRYDGLEVPADVPGEEAAADGPADVADAADEASACPPGYVECGGVCVDVTSNADHCGGCGLACPDGLVCNEGGCASSCSGTLTLCGTSCVDLSTHRMHCGACDHPCSDALQADGSCRSGSCVLECRAGWVDLDGAPGCEYACFYVGPTELCNDLDDDCDGETDEGFACRNGTTVACTTSCGTTSSGPCTFCGPPTGAACPPPAETCNGSDDDCDGSCDEGCRHGIHRSVSHEHFYTANRDEASCCGFTVETYDYFFLYDARVGDTTEFYRCYLSGTGDHLYTTSSTCEGAADALLEGSIGFIGRSAFCGAIPLYRVCGPGDHFYTTSAAERDAAVAGGWADEGLAGYVWTE
ncbi:MAG: hypothetical protein JXB32_09300 [Deltaproteobacteria bacterium]|nr:hypothetical protein [Deltaproteobacteria bacterium]